MTDEDDYVDPSQFKVFVNSEEEGMSKPDEYLPGTDPFASKNVGGRGKGRGKSSSSNKDEAANRPVDDWLGGSPSKAKRSWKVKGTTTAKPSSTETSFSPSSPTSSSPAAVSHTSFSPTARRWNPPSKNEAIPPPWASPRSEPSKPRTPWKKKDKAPVPPPVNRKPPAAVSHTDEAEKADTAEVPKPDEIETPVSPPSSPKSEKQDVEKAVEKNDLPNSIEQDSLIRSTDNLHDDREIIPSADEGAFQKEDGPDLSQPTPSPRKESVKNHRSILDEDDEDDNDDNEKPDPEHFKKLMYLQAADDNIMQEEYLPGTDPDEELKKKVKKRGSGKKYGSSSSEYSGTSRVDDWLGSTSSDSKPKRSWKAKS